MVPYIIVGVVIGLPLALGMIFRVSTSHVFFSLMAGELLARYFGSEAKVILDALTRNHNVGAYAELAVLVLPMILTAVLLKGSLSKGKAALHFAPLLVTGIVFAAFVLPILPVAAQDQVKTIEAGRQLLNTSNLIVGGVVLLQLVALWLLNGGKGHSKKH